MAAHTLRALIALSICCAAATGSLAYDRYAYEEPAPSRRPVYLSNAWSGYQALGYQEHVRDFFSAGVSQGPLDSDSAPANIVVGGGSEWRFPGGLILGSAVEYPAFRISSVETWRTRNGVFQQNRITYGITAFRGYVGYSVSGRFEPWGGFQYAIGEQFRSQFVTQGVPSNTTAYERIQALSWVLGVRGITHFESPWGEGWSMIYQTALTRTADVQTTNDQLAGTTFSSPGGSLEAQFGAGYSYGPQMRVGGMVSYTSLWYDGTGSSNQSASIWPQNSTQNWRFLLNWSFSR